MTYTVKEKDIMAINLELVSIQEALNKLFHKENGSPHLPDEVIEIACSLGRVGNKVNTLGKFNPQ